MKRKGLLTDRRALIAALEQEMGLAAGYQGAPSFRYVIGDYTVLRDGSLEVEDAKADTALIGRLADAGLVEGAAADTGISFPMDGFSGRTMTNIVNSLAARGGMINKAIGKPDAIHMGAKLVRTLKAENPDTISEFMDALHRSGGEKAMRGLRIAEERLVFTGLPDTPACHALAERIVQAAATRGWIKAREPETENEKYSFRVWLNALGMKGQEYAAARAELLKNLSGDSAFRTEEQRAAFYATRRQGRPAVDPEFILL